MKRKYRQEVGAISFESAAVMVIIVVMGVVSLQSTSKEARNVFNKSASGVQGEIEVAGSLLQPPKAEKPQTELSIPITHIKCPTCTKK